VAIADHAELAYCTPQFKKVLERVLHSCGLGDTTGVGVQAHRREDLRGDQRRDFMPSSPRSRTGARHPLQDRKIRPSTRAPGG
jgi:hypothetical protein